MDIAKKIKIQREYFLKGETASINFRIKQLKLLKKIIIDNEKEIMTALNKDFNKCEFESYSSEIFMILEEIKVAISKLKRWAKPKKVKTPVSLFKSNSYIYKEPYGVCLIIGAWNYPFQLTIAPLVAAIAAGNCAVLKPSELSKHTSKIITKLIKKIFNEKYCLVVEGGVKETTQLLKQQLDYIFFTGSKNIGKIIMQSAANNLTPVTLELGGKSPCIVDSDINLEVTARRILWGKFINAGQTCVAPDYIYVKKEIKQKLLNELTKCLKEFYGEDPAKSEDYARIINANHFMRLTKLMKKGKIIIGGETSKKDLYIAPTIIDNIDWKDPVMQDEIFGPILPILEYKKIEDVIKNVTINPKPLALYLFTNNKKLQKLIIDKISFGGGAINSTILHLANTNLPFGGVGGSGMGNYHGEAGFNAFSHTKSILNKSVLIDLKLIYPPYKNKLKLFKKII